MLQFVWSTNQNQMLMIWTSLPLESISLFFSLSSDSSSDCMCICKSSEDWSFATFCCSLFNINCQGEITPNESYLPEQVLHCCTVMLIFKKWQICDCVQFMFWMWSRQEKGNDRNEFHYLHVLPGSVCCVTVEMPQGISMENWLRKLQ